MGILRQFIKSEGEVGYSFKLVGVRMADVSTGGDREG